MAKSEKITCPICSLAAGNYYLTKNGYDLFRCAVCETIFVHPLPSLTTDIYSRDYFAGAKNGFGYVTPCFRRKSF